ncbi:MAG TPA: homoserine O-acetyltransferase [Acidimicrobiia bacterium]|nr:homoserine O-acetyltransferase [Acidimicrobiia bacterium]
MSEISQGVGRVETRFHTLEGPFDLQKGGRLPEVTLAYELYGEVNEARDNVILVFHALTGSQHAAGWNESVPGLAVEWTEECQLGWWDGFIGPGRALDTDRFAVMCVNYLGGCYGSTGPSSIDPTTGERYASRFPEVTLTDIVDSQMQMLSEMGIERVRAVIGGSVGGIMCIVASARYPDRVQKTIPIAAGLTVSSLQVIHNFEQMFAIVSDPEFKGGDYYGGPGPEVGLAHARMIGHKTFVSLEAMRNRARNEVLQHEDLGGYRVGHPLESYMLHQGQKFVRRFDANTYLRVMEVWQRFDLEEEVGAPTAELLARCRNQDWLVFTIDSDVCFYPEDQERMVAELNAAGVPVRWFTVHSDKGHDSFLIEPWLYQALLKDMLE